MGNGVWLQVNNRTVSEAFGDCYFGRGSCKTVDSCYWPCNNKTHTCPSAFPTPPPPPCSSELNTTACALPLCETCFIVFSLSCVSKSHIQFVYCVGHCRCIWNQTKRKCQPAPPPPAPPPLPGQNGKWNGPVKGTYGDADCPNVGCYGTSSRPYTVQECEKLCNSVQGCNAMNAGSIGCCLRACGPGMQHGPKLNGQCCGFFLLVGSHR